MSWRDRRLFAISQAGLVPRSSSMRWSGRCSRSSRDARRQPYGGRLDRRVYGFVWGGSQLFTGRVSDHVRRFWPNVLGMWICGAGVAMVVMGTARSGGRSRRGWRASAWRCLYPNSRRRWPTSRRPPGAARPSASTASGATSAMPSARSGPRACREPDRRGRSGPSGSLPISCSSPSPCSFWPAENHRY